ncbi:TetR/AcrR family transcriptional regulator [Streptomyces sp. NBC_01725]|uniref:TetR/AcrR family transcriptional regulator n=1 Tax=Streptomyces sp. NBC_01725 TaxID=2975923 RepID=UPI002E2E3E51|nr:TetR/AcrR family transcriptional regulator [Streptomyces sp. NBC_01725]
MPADEPVPTRPSLRERRRAAATQEILDAAELQLAEDGPAALSLRGVARSLGMTVQALYHYFPSRDSLVTSLVAKAYDDLADAVQTAVDTADRGTSAGEKALPRLVVATEGYRRWAIAHPEHFQLLYGTPLRYYAAPVDGPTTRAVRRMGAVFEREMFGGYTARQLAAAEMPALSTGLRTYLESLPPGGLGTLPAPATALFLSAWGQMHGLVVLEVFGHTAYLGDHQAEIFRVTMRNMTADIDRRILHT